MQVPQVDIPAFHNSLHPQNVFITLFDVLGFKERVENTQLSPLVNDYRNFITTQSRASTIHVATRKGVQNWKVGEAIFSDTIILWCDDNWDAVQTLIDASAITISEALDRGWPIRGAVAYGSCVIDQPTSTFVGKPIIDAHLVEQSQNWIGAALHSTVMKHPTLGAAVAKLENVKAYPVPVKPGSQSLEFALHWCPYSSHPLSELDRLCAATTNASALQKYAETRTYLLQTCQGFHASN